MEKVNLDTIRLAQGGDESAFQEIYDQCYSHVFYYAYNLSKSEADARDIAQETFLQVFRSIKNLKNPEYFPLWLNRITYSKFSNLMKKQKDTAIENEELNYFMDQSEKAIIQNEKAKLDDEDVIRHMIASLTEKQREVIELLYYQQFSIAEAAAYLNVSQGTIKSRVFQAKAALRKKIKAFEQLEQRKITLHTDVIVPALGFSVLSKLKSWFQTSMAQQTVIVASSVSLVVAGATAMSETANYVSEKQAEHIQEQLPVINKRAFHPVQYEGEQINTAKTAYYTLLKWAPEVEYVKEKTQAEKAEVRSIVDELIASQSNYLELMRTSGWMRAYEE